MFLICRASPAGRPAADGRPALPGPETVLAMCERIDNYEFGRWLDVVGGCRRTQRAAVFHAARGGCRSVDALLSAVVPKIGSLYVVLSKARSKGPKKRFVRNQSWMLQVLSMIRDVISTVQHNASLKEQATRDRVDHVIASVPFQPVQLGSPSNFSRAISQTAW